MDDNKLDTAPEQAADKTSETILSITVKTTPEIAQTLEPEEAPEAAFEAEPTAEPEMVPKQSPEAAPKAEPETVPKESPEAAPIAKPKAAPKATPAPAPKEKPQPVSGPAPAKPAERAEEDAGAPGRQWQMPKPPKLPKLSLRQLMRLLMGLLTVLMIALAVFLVFNRNRFNLDALKRQLTYRSLDRSDNGMAEAFSIGQEEEICCASLSGGVILVSESRIRLFSDGGVLYEDISTVQKNPVVQTCGSYAVVYDAGGNNLYLFADRQMIYQYSTQTGYDLISARVNQGGWLCVVEQASGYKGTVTVYDASQEAVLTERISSQFVMDAVLSPDSQLLGVLTIGQGETSFASTFSVYGISDGAMKKTVVVSDSPILDLSWDSDGLWLQHEFGLIRLNNQYEQIADWLNQSLHLKGYDLRGESFALEFFSRDRSGTLGQLISIDNTGTVIGTMNLSREILSVTAAGRYIAVLTSTQLTIYTSDFIEYATLPNTTGILTALMRADGTAMLVEAEAAGVFVP